jgi:hypothetical protein
LIWYKFIYHVPLLLFMGNLMTLLANWILAVPLSLYLINGFNISVLTICHSLLAIVFGALYPNFKAENVNRIFMSFGGTFYMMVALGLMFFYLGCQIFPGFIYYKVMIKLQTVETWQVIGASAVGVVGLLVLVFSTIFLYRRAIVSLSQVEDGND